MKSLRNHFRFLFHNVNKKGGKEKAHEKPSCGPRIFSIAMKKFSSPREPIEGERFADVSVIHWVSLTQCVVDQQPERFGNKRFPPLVAVRSFTLRFYSTTNQKPKKKNETSLNSVPNTSTKVMKISWKATRAANSLVVACEDLYNLQATQPSTTVR